MAKYGYVKNPNEKVTGSFAVGQRLANAQTDFINNVIEQFNFTRKEANKILEVYIEVKAVKLNKTLGKYQLTNGLFWDKEVMKRALKQ